MKESHILYAKRPLAISPAGDMKLECHGTLLDEELALKLGFPIRQLQYTRLSIPSKNQVTRVCGSVKVTVQIIENGKSGRSVALNAKVVRDLVQLTGAEALADSELMKKLNFKEKTSIPEPPQNKAGELNKEEDSDIDNEVPVHAACDGAPLGEDHNDLLHQSQQQEHLQKRYMAELGALSAGPDDDMDILEKHVMVVQKLEEEEMAGIASKTTFLQS